MCMHITLWYRWLAWVLLPGARQARSGQCPLGEGVMGRPPRMPFRTRSDSRTLRDGAIMQLQRQVPG